MFWLPKPPFANAPRVSGNVLQDLFADEPWRLQLCGDAFGELKQLGSTQQKARYGAFFSPSHGIIYINSG